MKCSSCGADIRDPEAVFCARCGAPIKQESEPTRDLGDVASNSEQAGSGPSDGRASETREQPAASSPTAGGDEPETREQTGASSSPPGYDPGPPPRSEQSGEQPQPYFQSRQDADPVAGPQTGRPPPGTQRQASGGATGASVPIRDFTLALRRSFVSGGWGEAAAAAAIGFLALLGLGALIVAALFIGGAPGLGKDPLEVLARVVLLGEAIMGVDLVVDFTLSLEGSTETLEGSGAIFSMVWLGALLIFGYALSWAVARSSARRSFDGPRRQALEGTKVAVPFAIYCLVAALLFKISSPPTTAGAGQALVLGAFWAVVFGALGGLRAGGSLRGLPGRALEGARAKRRSLYEGLSAGGIMLGTTALASTAAFLIMVIVALARNDLFDGLTIGGVVSGLVVLALTLPNVLSLVAAVSLGAPLTAQLGLTGDGSLPFIGAESISVIGLGGRTSGALALLLLVIPLLSCLLGGFSAYRHSLDRSKMLEVLAWAAATYAGALALLSLLNGVQFEGGAALFGLAGRVSVNFFAVLLLGLAWGGALGFAGWKLAEMQDAAPPQASPPQAGPPSNPGRSDYLHPGQAPPSGPAPPTREHRRPE